MTKSTVSRYCWAYESPYRTAAIVGASSTSYQFGEYSSQIKDWSAPSLRNKVQPFTAYNSRTPTLEDFKREFPAFTHSWEPTTAQHAVWLLGTCTDASPDTFEPYTTTTQKKSLTIRFEEDGGTWDRLINAVGCYLVELHCMAVIGNPYRVEGTFAWSDIEDEDDGSNAILTTMPTACGGAGVSQKYMGSPTVVYDVDGEGTGPATLTDVVMADWRIKQNWDYTMDSDDLGQTLYLYNFDPVDLTLTALMETSAKWDDFVDRNVYKYSVKVQKPDGNDYITWIFDNVHILEEQKSQEMFQGAIFSKIICQAEKVTGQFTFDGSGTWTDHFKTAA